MADEPIIRMNIAGTSEDWRDVDPLIATALKTRRQIPFIPSEGVASRWDVTWGPSVNLNPTRWERLKGRVANAARRLSDAYAVALGRKVAVAEDEYWGDC